MNKLAIAVLTAGVLTSSTVLPALAQAINNPCIRQQCSQSREVPCGEQLGHLKRVYPEQVLGIDNHLRVWVTEFCPGSELMRSDGNAAYLRPAIAQNDVLVKVLRGRGYFPADVFAVRMMGDDTISLYVHRFGN
jgi:hypothetical protein